MQGTYALHKLSTEAEFRCQGDFLYQDDSQDINDHIPAADIRLLWPAGYIWLNLFNTDMVVDDCLKKKFIIQLQCSNVYQAAKGNDAYMLDASSNTSRHMSPVTTSFFALCFKEETDNFLGLISHY